MLTLIPHLRKEDLMRRIVTIIAAAGIGVAAAGIALPILINKWKTRGKSETKSSDANQDVPMDSPGNGSTEDGGEGTGNLPAPTQLEENRPKVDVLCSSSTTEFKGHVYGCALANLTAEPIQVVVAPIVTKHESVTFTIPARRTYSFYSDTETFKLSVGDTFKCRVTKVVDKEYQYSGVEA
jgi:hypothetical protein